MLFETAIETDRLLLRPEVVADCNDIFRINTDPEVMRYIADGRIMSLSREELHVHLTDSLPKRVHDEYGLAAVVVKETGQYIGACWLKYDNFCGGVELGYRYAKEVWGKGYATEAGQAVLQAGFQLPQLKEVFSCSHPENLASLRVIKKLGFTYAYDRYHPLVKGDVPIYIFKRQS